MCEWDKQRVGGDNAMCACARAGINEQSELGQQTYNRINKTIYTWITQVHLSLLCEC